MTALFLAASIQGCATMPEPEASLSETLQGCNSGISNNQQFQVAVDFYRQKEEANIQDIFLDKFELSWIKNATDEQMANIPTAMLAELMDPLGMSRTMHEMMKSPKQTILDDLQAKLYEHYQPSYSYKSWDLSKKIQLVDALVSDERLIQSRQSWEDFSTDEKLDTFRYVAALQTRIYNSDNNYSLSGVKDIHIDESLRGTNVGGSNSLMSGMRINPIMLERFDHAMRWVLHEQFHRIQNDIIKHYKSGEMDQTDSLFYDVAILSRDKIGGFNLPADGNEIGRHRYKISPGEAGAYSFKGYWQFVGAGTDIFQKDEKLGAFRNKMTEKLAEYQAKANNERDYVPNDYTGVDYLQRAITCKP